MHASVPLLDHRLLFFTGKGGVGKSTVTCALALLAARRGKRVCVVELDTYPAARQFLGVPHVGFVPLEAAPGVHAINIDPVEAIHEYVSEHIPIRRVARAISENRMLGFFFRAAPSVYELASMHKVWSLVEQGDPATGARFDLVLVDLPATGHAYTFLHTPRAVAELLNVGPMNAFVRKYLDLLCDRRKTRINLVTLPEEMPVNETAELYARLRAWAELPLGVLAVNQVERAPFSADRLDLLAGLERTAHGAPAAEGSVAHSDRLLREALAVGRAEHERHVRQRECLADLARRVSMPIVELSQFAVRRMDREALRRVGDELEAGLAGLRLNS